MKNPHNAVPALPLADRSGRSDRRRGHRRPRRAHVRRLRAARVAPASVERPDNPKSFALNLLNHLAGSSGLPKDYAMEVAPYWLTSHPSLTFRQYQRPSPLQSIAQDVFGVDRDGPAGRKDRCRAGKPPRRGFPHPGVERKAKCGTGRAGRRARDDQRHDSGQIGQGLPIDDQRAAARTKSLELQGLDAERVGFFLAVAGGQVWSIPDGGTRKKRRRSGADSGSPLRIAFVPATPRDRIA